MAGRSTAPRSSARSPERRTTAKELVELRRGGVGARSASSVRETGATGLEPATSGVTVVLVESSFLALSTKTSANSWSDPVPEPERWQVSTDAAEVYESCFVPAIFGAWASRVADAAGIRRGNRVLDVGCGTGVLAREAVRRVGREGQVVGLDLNEGMLAVAARTEPKIEWRQGDAASLPFEDASFEVVVSQFALMYFPERVTSLREMWRTLASRGRLAIAAWAPLGRARGYQILVDIATRQCGGEAANVLAAPFVLGDQAELAKLVFDGGISGANVTLLEGSIRFPSVKESYA
jgi:SAM-dependent methyltransferase